MSEQSRYTAQEMRDVADFYERNAYQVRAKVMSNSILANIHESVAMLRQAADAMEREEREKKYEYAIEWHNGVIERGTFNRARALSEVKGSNIHGVVCKLVRREVGEWEDVKDER